MKYRSRLCVAAWKVNFAEPPPKWVEDEINAPYWPCVRRRLGEAAYWYDVYNKILDDWISAPEGDWIVCDRGEYIRLKDELFNLMYEAFDDAT